MALCECVKGNCLTIPKCILFSFFHSVSWDEGQLALTVLVSNSRDREEKMDVAVLGCVTANLAYLHLFLISCWYNR